MFRRLFLNTVFSGAAFLVAGLIGLIIIPLLVKSYGLAEFGLIVLARMLLPTGVLSVFDFGFSEVAAKSVARARETDNWEVASHEVTLLIMAASGVGIILGATLFFLAPHISNAFDVDTLHQESFQNIVRITAIALLVIFPALVAEGIVKGFENYSIVRAAEVFGTLLYAAMAVAVAYAGLKYDVIAYAFLGSVIVRYVLLIVSAAREGKPRLGISGIRAYIPGVFGQCQQMALGRSLGALQGQVPAPVLGLVLGPSAVAVYDILVRLPRFAKNVIAVLNSALLPVAARIDASKNTERMSSLGTWGLMVSSAVALPLLATGALFSEPLLRLWVGTSFSELWSWHALMFLVPAVNAMSSMGTTSLLVRPEAFARVNRVAAFQIVMQYAVSFAAINIWQERAFILGQCIAMLVGFPWIMRIIVQEQRLPTAHLAWLLAKIGLMAVLLASGYWSIKSPYAIAGWTELVVNATVWCLVFLLAVWWFAFDASHRKRLIALVWSCVMSNKRTPSVPGTIRH